MTTLIQLCYKTVISEYQYKTCIHRDNTRYKYKTLLMCKIENMGHLCSNVSGVLYFFQRQLHVMDETYVINQVKEDVCYVSQEFYKDMQIAQ